MYIWVLLATFITVLFSFNLGVRSDLKELYVDNQAAAVASKLYVQHKAAEEYYKDSIKRFKKGLGESPHFTTLTDINAMRAYAAVPNFNPADGASTTLYCMNREKFDKPFFKNSSGTQCQATEENGGLGAAIDCCSGSGPDGKAYKYVVTVVPVPVRWQARNAAGQPINVPNSSMINALKNISSNRLGLGYMIYDGEKYYIKGVSDEPMLLYKAIGEELEKKGCGVDSSTPNKEPFCMIFATSL